MNGAGQQVERRKHCRYKIKDHLLVTNTSKNGPIDDVSLGGVAFYCIPKQERPGETIKFGTLVGSDFCLSRVPLEEVAASSRVEGNVVLNRYGLRFGDLSEEQQAELARIIQTLK